MRTQESSNEGGYGSLPIRDTLGNDNMLLGWLSIEHTLWTSII